MGLDVVFAFLAGAFVDVLRGVFVPESTRWISSLIPWNKKKKNLDDNLEFLKIRKMLSDLQMDPNLSDKIYDDNSSFRRYIKNQEDVHYETHIEYMNSQYMTQSDMNMEARRILSIGMAKLDSIVETINSSDLFTDDEKNMLAGSQRLWLEHATLDAKFEAGGFDGGSMQPMIESSALETTVTSRTARLRQIYEDRLQRENG